MNYRDLAERAAWTAVQAFLGVFLAANIGSVEGAKSAALAGAVAAVAAVLSLVKNVARQKLGAKPPLDVEPLEASKEAPNSDPLL